VCSSDLTLIPYLTDEAIPSGSSHVHGVVVDAADLDHWHTVNIPAHTHSVSDHDHEIELEPHTHPIEHGIFQLETLPTNVEIKVDGNLVSFSGTSADELNLIPYLSKDGNGKVSRGKHIVSLTPDDRGRINAQVNTQFFIQSRGQYTL